MSLIKENPFKSFWNLLPTLIKRLGSPLFFPLIRESGPPLLKPYLPGHPRSERFLTRTQQPPLVASWQSGLCDLEMTLRAKEHPFSTERVYACDIADFHFRDISAVSCLHLTRAKFQE